jgi:hypothetical protein
MQSQQRTALVYLGTAKIGEDISNQQCATLPASET